MRPAFGTTNLGDSMTYDQKCYDLAMVFLLDRKDLKAAERNSLAHTLAQDIQRVIEDRLYELDQYSTVG
jgi:hypothetical protein